MNGMVQPHHISCRENRQLKKVLRATEEAKRWYFCALQIFRSFHCKQKHFLQLQTG